MNLRIRRAGLGLFVGLVAGFLGSVFLGSAAGAVLGAEITGVVPAVVCKTGGERISNEGRGFTRTMVPKLDGADFPVHEFKSETLWEATLPALGSLDFHTVSLVEDRTEASVLPSAFQSILPHSLRDLEPAQLPETGGTLFRILGDGFRPVEKIAVTIGGMPATVLFVSADGTAINCVAPAHAPGAASVVGGKLHTIHLNGGKAALPGGGPTPSPGPAACGVDPTVDGLAACVQPACP